MEELAGDLVITGPVEVPMAFEVDFDKTPIMHDVYTTGIALCTASMDGAASVALNIQRLNGPVIRYVPRTKSLAVIGRKPIDITSKLWDNLLWTTPCSHTHGFDPEIFIHDGTGKLLPAPEFLPEKAHGLDATWMSENYVEKVYADGFAAEMTTKASACLAWSADGIRDGLHTIREAARRKHPKADFLAETLVVVEQEEMDKLSDEQTALGCMPSFNAYGLKAELPQHGRLLLRRSVGGHLHHSTPKMELNTACKITRIMDALVGVMSVALFQGFEHPDRRRFYGLPGEFRLPKHGYEYRVLSNCWMWHPAVYHVTTEFARTVLRAAWSGLGSLVKADAQEVVETITYLDVKRAQELLQRNRELIMFLLLKQNTTPGVAEAAFNMMLNGMVSKVKDPRAIAENWMLNDGADEWQRHTHNSMKTWSRQWNQLGI